VQADQIPEAALFARTYAPSRVSELTQLWKTCLQKQGKRLTSEKIADPF